MLQVETEAQRRKKRQRAAPPRDPALMLTSVRESHMREGVETKKSNDMDGERDLIMHLVHRRRGG